MPPSRGLTWSPSLPSHYRHPVLSHSDVEVVGRSQQFQRHLGGDGELRDGHLAVVVLDLRVWLSREEEGEVGREGVRGGRIKIGPPPKAFSSSPCSACTG